MIRLCPDIFRDIFYALMILFSVYILLLLQCAHLVLSKQEFGLCLGDTFSRTT
jgi:hypothetical protein